MEYRSKATFLGLPLVHIAIGGTPARPYARGVATGWIAIGDVAIGVLVACGGVALASVSVGGIALGLLPIGGVALGVLAVGGLAVGVVAAGGAAFASYAAVGGFAMARQYAIGGLAVAPQVLSAPTPGTLPLSRIPHPPFRSSDALSLVLIIALMLVVAVWVRGRRHSR